MVALVRLPADGRSVASNEFLRHVLKSEAVYDHVTRDPGKFPILYDMFYKRRSLDEVKTSTSPRGGIPWVAGDLVALANARETSPSLLLKGA